MAEYTVTVVDTTGIQPYIFGSNRLQENIGASELVRLATEPWALEAVRGVAAICNVTPELTLAESFAIENHPGDDAAEVLYASGGNIVIVFSAPTLARAFTRQLTRRVLIDAPGLNLVVAHRDKFVWNTPAREGDPALAQVVQDLLGPTLAERKAARMPSLPLLGLGVTAACQATGLAATRTDEELRGKKEKDAPVRLISRETEAKLTQWRPANKRLQNIFRRELGTGPDSNYKFPNDIDQLARQKGEESYVAIVHADGNGMGQRISSIAKTYSSPQHNREYIKELRSFSQRMDKAAMTALHRVVRTLTHATHRGFIANELPVEVDKKDSKEILPFRPLVFGGDDVTFLCNARLGLALATGYLQAFEEEVKRQGLGGLHACAGVAMVKMHYPFARAYQLSEELTKSAKGLVREPASDASALDWHFAGSGLSGKLEQIRGREYQVNAGDLLMRPVLLRPAENDQDGRSWSVLERLVVTFQEGPGWYEKRNKVKALREALRAGPGAVETFIGAYSVGQLPPVVTGQKDFQTTGWFGERCGYFDAIEMLDHYLRLELAEGAA